MDVTTRRGRRRKKLLDDLKDRRGYSHLKEEALDRTCGGIVLEEALDLSSDRLLNKIIIITGSRIMRHHALTLAESRTCLYISAVLLSKCGRGGSLSDRTEGCLIRAQTVAILINRTLHQIRRLNSFLYIYIFDFTQNSDSVCVRP